MCYDLQKPINLLLQLNGATLLMIFLSVFLSCSQELEIRLSSQDGPLKKILALAKFIAPNTSSAGQKIIKDDIQSLEGKQKDLENRIQSAKQETETLLNSLLQSKCSTEKKEKFHLASGAKQVTSEGQASSEDSAALGKLKEGREIKAVSVLIAS